MLAAAAMVGLAIVVFCAEISRGAYAESKTDRYPEAWKLPMYERFTDSARKVMQLAEQEAMRLNHEYVGTEHLLLGLVKAGNCVGVTVLLNVGVELGQIQAEIGQIPAGPELVTMGELPHTPRAKRVIEYAIDEAGNLGHNWVGSEHLLLGRIREQDGVAGQILRNMGLKLEDVRQEVLNVLGQGKESGS